MLIDTDYNIIIAHSDSERIKILAKYAKTNKLYDWRVSGDGGFSPPINTFDENISEWGRRKLYIGTNIADCVVRLQLENVIVLSFSGSSASVIPICEDLYHLGYVIKMSYNMPCGMSGTSGILIVGKTHLKHSYDLNVEDFEDIEKYGENFLENEDYVYEDRFLKYLSPDMIELYQLGEKADKWQVRGFKESDLDLSYFRSIRDRGWM